MSVSSQPERLAERAAPAGEPTTEASIRAIGPGPEAGSQGKSRTAVRQSAGEVAAVPEPAHRLGHEDALEAELGALIDELELSELQKRCLRARWLDAIIWMERKAKQAQRLYMPSGC